ncbi:MAG: putative glycosyltransferase [Gemmatimonadetes bacterium]|nr:putative glycosyltransferase [Gemmatimonadota bacterium]
MIVPTYERNDSLEQCLHALAAQDLPRAQFEVVVVDDGSEHPARPVIERFQHRLDVRYHEQANAGPATARNAGAAAARGAYLVFTDDDCRPDARWLSVLGEMIARHPDCAVGGRVDNALGDGVYSSASQHLIEYLYEYYNASDTEGRFFITSNLAFPAAQFRAIGGFDVSFPLAAAEDRDLCDRWREAGHEMVYCDDAIVRHAHALDFRTFCRQHFNYGRGAYHLHRARSRRGSERLRIEPPHFYSRLVAFPISRAPAVRAVGLSSLLMLSQVVYVGGYLLERATFQVRARAPA